MLLAHARAIGHNRTFQWVVAADVLALLVGATFFLPGGQDLALYYRPFAQGCLTCGYVPYHTFWLLAPLAWIPEEIQWPAWTLLTCLTFFWTAHRLGTNPLVVLLSFPFFGLIWLGQIDAVLTLGLVLTLTSGNPWLRSIGLLLMSVKPQVTGAAMLVVLWHERERRLVLLMPVLVFLLSLVLWGWDWPLRWLAHQPVEHVWRLASLFPYGLAAFAAVPLVHKPLPRVRSALLAQALATPFVGVYSYANFLVLGAPWWAAPLSYAWALLYPWYGSLALSLAWVLPLALLFYELRSALRKRAPGVRGRQPIHVEDTGR